MKYLTHLLGVFILFSFVACSGGSNQNKSASESESSSGAQSTEMSGTRTIHIYGVDQMKFSVASKSQGIETGGPVVQGDSLLLLNSITAEPGEKIHIVLTTRSKLPASAMSHNWVLLKQSADPEAFDQAATKAKDNDYIPTEMTDQMIAHVSLTSGGQTNEVTFTAPQQTGDYEYLCSFPGHFSAGMRGTLKVGSGGASSSSDSDM